MVTPCVPLARFPIAPLRLPAVVACTHVWCSLQDLTHLTARVLFGTYDNSNALFGVLAQLAVSLYLIQSVRAAWATPSPAPPGPR
jgi:hypothetical protein